MLGWREKCHLDVRDNRFSVTKLNLLELIHSIGSTGFDCTGSSTPMEGGLILGQLAHVRLFSTSLLESG